MRRYRGQTSYVSRGTIAGTAIALLLAMAASLFAQSGDQTPEEIIMFGSCLYQSRAHRALGVAVEREPDAFVFLGDNVYADSTNPVQIRAAYDRLARSDLFGELRRTTDIYAVLSGDRHFAEISRAPAPGTDQRYFYDVTSSGINRRYPEEVPTANANRVDAYYLHYNVGELTLFRNGGELRIRARIYDEDGGVRIEKVIDFGI